jgi:hypothetical protein
MKNLGRLAIFSLFFLVSKTYNLDFIKYEHIVLKKIQSQKLIIKKYYQGVANLIQ